MFLHRSFKEMGIPAGYGRKQLLFCPAAETLVVQVESVGNWRPERLLMRAITSERYTPVGSPADMVSQEDPVVSNSKPLLAYNGMLHKFDIGPEGEERHFGEWESLKVIDLIAGSEAATIDRQSIHFADGVTDGWISSILSFAGESDALHVVAAMSRDRRQTMEYHLSELHLQSGVLHSIANLPAIFLKPILAKCRPLKRALKRWISRRGPDGPHYPFVVLDAGLKARSTRL